MEMGKDSQDRNVFLSFTDTGQNPVSPKQTRCLPLPSHTCTHPPKQVSPVRWSACLPYDSGAYGSLRQTGYSTPIHESRHAVLSVKCSVCGAWNERLAPQQLEDKTTEININPLSWLRICPLLSHINLLSISGS
ncbi:unnamed protein product [Lepidochelys olivacea]